MKRAVLIVDDEQGIREGLATAMRRAGWDAVPASGLAAARTTLAHRAIDCVLLDVRLKDGDGLEMLRELKGGAHRDIPVIIATAYGDGERTIAAMRDGAFDYVTKPFDLNALTSSVRRALERGQTKLHPLEQPDGTLVGRSAAMQEVWKRIGRAAATHEPLLVHGERGSGKDTIARAVHRFSTHDKLPLRIERASELSAAQLPALTDALGTLVIDEVTALSASAAHALAAQLRANTKARIIATCTDTANNDPYESLDQTLKFQLAVLDIEVPPLRARKSDIPLLVAHVLQGSHAVAEDAMSRLLAHDWPGNVGELFAVIRRAAAMAHDDVIDSRALPEEWGTTLAPTHNPYLGMPMRDAVALLERDLLVHALDQAAGNRTSAARLLGIARAQLYAKLNEHGLEGHGKER